MVLEKMNVSPVILTRFKLVYKFLPAIWNGNTDIVCLVLLQFQKLSPQGDSGISLEFCYIIDWYKIVLMYNFTHCSPVTEFILTLVWIRKNCFVLYRENMFYNFL